MPHHFGRMLLTFLLTFLVGESARPDSPDIKTPARADLSVDPLPKGAIARLGTLRFRHADPVTAMVFARDGKALLSASGGEGSRDNTIRQWALPDGREIRRFVGHRSGIFCIALSPDGNRLASAGNGGEIRIWDVATGQGLASFSADHHRVLTLAFSPDGTTLATAGSDHQIHLWDLGKEKEIRTFTGHMNDISKIIFTPNGKSLISGGEDHTVRLWDVTTGKEVRQFGEARQAKGKATALSPDGKVLVSADGEVYRWDLATGRQLGDRLGGILRTDVSGQFLAFSPDGGKLAVQGWSGWIYLWDVEKDREIHKLQGPYGIYNNLAFSPDGKLLAAGGYGNTIRFWETATGQELHASRGQQGPITWLGFARGDKSLVAASNNSARVWDLGVGKEPLVASGRQGDPLAQGDSFALSLDGRTLATGRWGEKLRFVDVATGEMEDRSPQDPPSNSHFAFGPNGRQIFLVDRDGKTVILWSRLAGRETRRFVGHLASIRSMAVSPDGRHLATASETATFGRGKPQPDDSIRLWDVATGRERWRLPTSSWALTFSPDGRLLAGGGRNEASHLWETDTGKEVRQFSGPQGLVYQVAFSPDGKTVAFTARDGIVRLWEVLTGKERCQLLGHQGDVYALAFSTDGRRLASGGNDTSVLLWDVTGWYATVSEPTVGPSGGQSVDFSSLWRDLGSSDAALAYRAVWQLVGAENKAVTFLKTHLPPVQPVMTETISKWIKDLDNNHFAVRERANQALEKTAELAEPALRQALEEKPTLEARRQIQRLLAGLADNQSPDRLRGLRAIEALENIATPESRGLLKGLVAGVAQARITREAKASLDRLDRRDAAPPWSPLSYQPTPDGERVLQTIPTTRKDPYGGFLPSGAVARLGPVDPKKKTLLAGLCFSPDGKWVMIGNGTSVLRLWDKAEGKPIREFQVDSGNLDEATLSPDGKLLAAATRQGSKELFWCLWDVASGRELRRMPVANAVSGLCFSADGKQIVVGMDGKVRLLDVATATERRTFESSEEGVGYMACSPDGKVVAMAERSAVRICDMATGRLLRRLGNAGSLAFSPNGLFLAIGVSFWEVGTGKELFRIVEAGMGGVFGGAFSPDGRTLATSSWDGQVRLWELATGQIRRTFKGHTDRLFRVAFSRDGREVASGGVEGSVLVWDCTDPGAKDRPALTTSELAALWDLLAYGKAEKAYQAEWRLWAAGQQTVAFMEKNLRPISKEFVSPLAEAIVGLEENRQELRDAAMNELDRFGSLAEPTLRKALADTHSPEARARMEYLLEKQESNFPSGGLLRSLRAIEVLEQIGTPQARQLLESIAAGHPQAALTREAKASVQRMAK